MLLVSLLLCIAVGSSGFRRLQKSVRKSMTMPDIAQRLMRVIERKEAVMTSGDEDMGRPTFAWEDEGDILFHHADNWRVKHLPMGALSEFLEMAQEKYEEEASTGRYAKNVQSADGGHSVIIGDIHGQLFFMLPLLEDIKNKHPGYALLPGSDLLICDKRLQYVFLGDFVDRGAHGIEVATLALAYKVLCPYVTLLKGNHELKNINDMYGFTDEVVRFELATSFASKSSTPSISELKYELQDGYDALDYQDRKLRKMGNYSRRYDKARKALRNARRELHELATSVWNIDSRMKELLQADDYDEGQKVEYFSSTHNGWVPATILKHVDGGYQIDLKPDATIAADKLRLQKSEATRSPSASGLRETVRPDLKDLKLMEAELKRARLSQVQQFRKLLLDVLAAPPHRQESKLYQSFLGIFDRMPLLAVVEDRALAMHAGLHSDLVNLCDDDEFETCLTKAWQTSIGNRMPPAIEGVLWSDPNRDENAKGWTKSKRGAGQMFAPSVAYDFLKKKRLKWLVRAHEWKATGFEEIYYERRKNGTDSLVRRESTPADVYPNESISIFTVFSAGDYCATLEEPGKMANSAAYLVVAPTGAPVVHKLRPEEARMLMSQLGKNHSRSLRALEDAMKETSVDRVVHHYETILRVKSLKEMHNATADMEIDMDGASDESQAFEATVRETLMSALALGDENGGRTREEILTMEAARLIEETGEAPVKPDQLVTYTSMDYSIVRVFDELGGKLEDKQKLLLSIARRNGVQLHLPEYATPASSSDSDEVLQKPPSDVVYLLAFRSIDKDGDGEIKEGEFREALTSVQDKLGGEADVNAMVFAAFSAVMGEDGLNFREFTEIMRGLS